MILPNFLKNCLKLKEFGPPGGRASLAPPLDPPLQVSWGKGNDAQCYTAFSPQRHALATMRQGMKLVVGDKIQGALKKTMNQNQFMHQNQNIPPNQNHLPTPSKLLFGWG